jgi:thioredoxin 1
MGIKEISAPQFEQEVLKSDKLVLVDFWAPWCGPCQMLTPQLKLLAEDPELKDKLQVIKVNVEEPANQLFSVIFQINTIPHMKLFRGGKIVGQILGFKPAAALKADIAQIL